MSRPSIRESVWGATGLLVAASAGAGAGALAAPAALTAADYARAERLMPYNTEPLVLDGVSDVTWSADGKLSYRTTTARGSELVTVDPATGTRQAAPGGA